MIYKRYWIKKFNDTWKALTLELEKLKLSALVNDILNQVFFNYGILQKILQMKMHLRL